MNEFSERWLQRLVGVVSGLNWVFLALGTVTILVTWGTTFAAVSSLLAAGAYVVLLQVTPRRMLRIPFLREAVVLTGTLATAFAMVVTGGTESPWLLLGVTPVVLASLIGGFRLGLATAGLTVAIVAGGEMIAGRFEIAQFAPVAGFDILAAITFGYARRLILEAVERADTLALLSMETGARLERLENTNQLLQRLSSITDTAELNPSEVAEATLATVSAVVPFRSAELILHTQDGPLTVASRGRLSLEASSEPLQVNGRQVGELRIDTGHPLTSRQHDLLRDITEPASVAFSNIRLLQSIAREAIRDERTRLARELHDEIGPGLASLGLSLDLAEMEAREGALDDGQIRALRTRVTQLLDEVRAAVADLRNPDELGLAATIARIRAKLPVSAPVIKVSVDERRPPRPAVAADLYAIAGEAIRNAARHSTSKTIMVTGLVDFDHGRLEIADRGVGFDPGGVPDGHFGLIGMRERAEKIGAELSVVSTPGSGTTIALQWDSTS